MSTSLARPAIGFRWDWKAILSLEDVMIDLVMIAHFQAARKLDLSTDNRACVFLTVFLDDAK